MTPARPLGLLITGIVATVLGWLALDTWSGRGGDPPPLPWTAIAGTVALALAVVAAGLPVRRWVQGSRERPLDALVAARTVVFAKAAAYAGALLAGWYAAQGLALLPDLVGSRVTHLVLAGIATLAAVGLAVAGLVVQRWCRVPPQDDDEPPADPAGHGS